MKPYTDRIGTLLAWMPDNGAGDTGAVAPTPDAEPEKGKPEPERSATFDREYVEKLRRENAERRTQVREMETKLAALDVERKSAEEKRLADQQEWQTLAEQRAAEIAKLTDQLKQKEVDVLRVRVAAAFGLNVPLDEDGSETLADRLRGTTEDELRADAQKLAKLLPKPAPQAEVATPTPETPAEQQPAGAQPSNEARRHTTAVPGGQPVGRTDADRRNEYLTPSTDSPIFGKGKVTINSKSHVIE